MGYSHYDAAVRGRAAWNSGKTVGIHLEANCFQPVSIHVIAPILTAMDILTLGDHVVGIQHHFVGDATAASTC